MERYVVQVLEVVGEDRTTPGKPVEVLCRWVDVYAYNTLDCARIIMNDLYHSEQWHRNHRIVDRDTGNVVTSLGGE